MNICLRDYHYYEPVHSFLSQRTMLSVMEKEKKYLIGKKAKL